MGILRVLICILFPPLAVMDKGCGVLLLVCVLTVCGWIPGVLAALIICVQQPQSLQNKSAHESFIGAIALLVFLAAIAACLWVHKSYEQSSDINITPNRAVQPTTLRPSESHADKTDANSQKAPNAAIDAGLAEKLASTAWSVPYQKIDPSKRWFTLNSDMTLRVGWSNELRWWGMLDDSRIVLQTARKEKAPSTKLKILTFNKEFTEATDQFKCEYHRVEGPAAQTKADSAPPAAAATTSPTATYSIVKRWLAGAGENKTIVILPEMANETSMMALGQQLRQDTKDDSDSIVFVFDDTQAAQMHDRIGSLSQSEDDFYDKHFMGLYTRISRNGVHTLEIHTHGLGGPIKTVQY